MAVPVLVPSEYIDALACPYPPGLRTRGDWVQAWQVRIDCLLADRAAARAHQERVNGDPLIDLLIKIEKAEKEDGAQ